MNWYKKSQSIIKHSQEFPSDEEMGYYTGQYPNPKDTMERWQEGDDYDEQIRRNERRHEKLTKIHLNEEAIKDLEKKLLDPSLTGEQRKNINLQIGKHRGAISHIINTVK